MTPTLRSRPDRLRMQFESELATAGLPAGPGPSCSVTEDDLSPLPEPVQRYLRFMGVVGRARDWSFRLHCRARFRPALDADWKPAESWQYNSSLDVARIFHMKLQFYGIPVVGRDLYLRGAGHLIIRPLDLVTIEHDRGPAFDQSELVTWLNDAVLFAPSMLLSPRTEWTSAGHDAFDVAVTDAGQTACARVLLEADGAPVDFVTDDRSMRISRGKGVRRARWSTPIPGWQVVDGRRLPTGGRAIWHLPAGEFAYAELEVRPGDIEFNVPPCSGA